MSVLLLAWIIPAAYGAILIYCLEPFAWMKRLGSEGCIVASISIAPLWPAIVAFIVLSGLCRGVMQVGGLFAPRLPKARVVERKP